MRSAPWSRRGADAELEAQIPLLASTLARSAHAGAALVTAVDDAAAALDGPAGAAMVEVRDAVGRGVPLDRALARWSERTRSEGARLLVTAAGLGHRHGGDLGRAFDAVALVRLDAAEVAEESRALATQARTSAGVLVALPPFGVLCFALVDPTVLATLLGTPLGWCCLVLGASLDLAGAMVMRSMVRRALR